MCLALSQRFWYAIQVRIGLNFDGEVCFDKGVVDEKFNSFASKLVEKLPKSVNKFEKQFVQSFIKVKVFHQIVIHFQWFQKTKPWSTSAIYVPIKLLD